jgi:hypothetical protein
MTHGGCGEELPEWLLLLDAAWPGIGDRRGHPEARGDENCGKARPAMGQWDQLQRSARLQKRGCGVYWRTVEKTGRNPKTGNETTTTRRELITELELPMKEAYGDFVSSMIA